MMRLFGFDTGGVRLWGASPKTLSRAEGL